MATLRRGISSGYIENDKMPPGIAARRGTALYEVTNINNKQKITTDQDLPLDTLQDAARDAYVKILQTDGVFIPKTLLPEKNRILNDGLNQVIQATAVYHREIAPQIQPVTTERTIQADIPGIPFPFQGTIDTSEDDRGFIHD